MQKKTKWTIDRCVGKKESGEMTILKSPNGGRLKGRVADDKRANAVGEEEEVREAKTFSSVHSAIGEKECLNQKKGGGGGKNILRMVVETGKGQVFYYGNPGDRTLQGA